LAWWRVKRPLGLARLEDHHWDLAVGHGLELVVLGGATGSGESFVGHEMLAVAPCSVVVVPPHAVG
jgi:hypothetical protein